MSSIFELIILGCQIDHFADPVMMKLSVCHLGLILFDVRAHGARDHPTKETECTQIGISGIS